MKMIKNFTEVLRKTIIIAIKSSLSKFLIYISSLLCMAILFVCQANIEQKLFDNALNFIVDGRAKKLIFSFMMFVLIYICTQIMIYLSNGIEEILMFKLQKQLTREICLKVSKINPEYFEDSSFLDRLTKAMNGKDAMITIALCTLSLICYYFPYFVLMSFWLININPILVLMIPIAFIPSIVLYIVQIKVFIDNIDKTAPLKRRLQSYEENMIGKKYIKETRILGCLDYFMDLYTKVLDSLTSKEVSVRKRRHKLNLCLKIVHATGYIIIILITLYLVMNKSISIGSFAAIISSLDILFSNMDEAISRQFGTISEQFGSIYKYNEFMNDKVFCDEYNEEYFINEIQNVTFKYPNTDEPTLKDISLTISQGERIAIVGENGSGKSTLVKLLLGIYKPTEGKIISKIKIENGKSAIFQNYLGYAMSLIDNIVISDSDDKIDMDKLSRVMKQSGVSGIASKLENGFSTLLGKEFGGHELSGGELQKVALARGTYKDSDFIVFDEPTSSIDPIEESRMYDIIESITEYKTALIVTHRMGSVQFADRILVLKNGKIVEEGTHTMLLELNGEYKKLYTTQSKNYDHNYIS